MVANRQILYAVCANIVRILMFCLFQGISRSGTPPAISTLQGSLAMLISLSTLPFCSDPKEAKKAKKPEAKAAPNAAPKAAPAAPAAPQAKAQEAHEVYQPDECEHMLIYAEHKCMFVVSMSVVCVYTYIYIYMYISIITIIYIYIYIL